MADEYAWASLGPFHIFTSFLSLAVERAISLSVVVGKGMDRQMYIFDSFKILLAGETICCARPYLPACLPIYGVER